VLRSLIQSFTLATIPLKWHMRIMQNTLTTFQSHLIQRQFAAPFTSSAASKNCVVYGRVYNQYLQPAANMTVLIVNNQDVWFKAAGYARTDDSGSFNISYSPPGGAPMNAYLEVVNHDQEVVYRGNVPLNWSPGAPQSVNIMLSPNSP
jgi:hypothetical protein